ncbi:MAG: DNA cytosine methyltransferase [Methanobrevibacter sp.]|jgi:DNA (cytosine-5)-methyltransferase 1|nr:DNA cytosine methyltransferase [Candidatus Methanovirga basalitermitum]
MTKCKDNSKWSVGVPVEESGYLWKNVPKTTKRPLDNTNHYTVVDLFCGAGGASTGFISAGFNVILGIDYFEPAMATFLHNHENSPGILGDIKRVDERIVRECIGDTDVKVVIAGVPCQGFSLSNRKRYEDDPRNQLFYEFIRFIEMLEPDMVMLENVSGMKSMGNGKVVKEIESKIAEAGMKNGKKYKVQHRMLNAAEYGVPQLRNRLIFLGASENYSIRWPKKVYSKTGQFLTVEDAIGDLPRLQSNETKICYEASPKNKFQEKMRQGSKIILNNKAPNHPKSTIERIKYTKPGKPMYDKYKQRIRLHWGFPSPTQVCGGIRPQFQFGHPNDDRGLTIRERARIQTFPDNYEFLGGIVQGRVQTGNAVPPLLAEAIGREMINEIKNPNKNKGEDLFAF